MATLGGDDAGRANGADDDGDDAKTYVVGGMSC